MKKRILVVDDESNVWAKLAGYLGLEYDVFTTQNGQDALYLLPRFQPDLVITDQLMEVIDGTKLVRLLAKTKHHYKIVVLSKGGKDLLYDKTLCADAVLEKPVRLEVLKQTIEDFI